MNECSFIETRSDQTKFRLNKIMKLKTFNSEIWERKIMSKKLSKYIAAFDYFDKALIVLSGTSGVISITSFTSITAVPVGIASASFNLVFFLTTGIVKKLLKITRNKKKKRNNILMLAKVKLNSFETLISLALIDLQISQDEFRTIINEGENYRRLRKILE